MPLLLGLCPGPIVCGARWPDVQDEHEAAMTLIRIDRNWEISVMANRPALLGQRYVTAETCVSFSDAAEKETAEKLRSAAMRAFRAVTKPPSAVRAKRPRRQPGASAYSAARKSASGPAGAAAASSSDRPLAPSRPLGVDPSQGGDSDPGSLDSSETESSGSSFSDEDLKHSWHTVMYSLKKYKGKPGRPSKAAATSAVEPPLAWVPEAAAAEPPLVRVPEPPAAAPPSGARTACSTGPAA